MILKIRRDRSRDAAAAVAASMPVALMVALAGCASTTDSVRVVDRTELRVEGRMPAVKPAGVTLPKHERQRLGPPPYGYIKIIGEPMPEWNQAQAKLVQDSPDALNWTFLGPKPISSEYWSGNQNAGGHIATIAPPPHRHHDLLHRLRHRRRVEDHGQRRHLGAQDRHAADHEPRRARPRSRQPKHRVRRAPARSARATRATASSDPMTRARTGRRSRPRPRSARRSRASPSIRSTRRSSM
jgi:hypothetical protein